MALNSMRVALNITKQTKKDLCDVRYLYPKTLPGQRESRKVEVALSHAPELPHVVAT